MNREHKAPANYTPENIASKTALVTGGTTGIGRATAILLAERGARVFIFGRHEAELNEALQAIEAAGGQAFGAIADQSKREDVERVFGEVDEKLGALDILINNAAVSSGSVSDTTFDEVHYTIHANILGYMSCAQLAIERMKKAGSGHIVNIGSMSADAREEGSDIYVATKSAIQGFSESLRKTINPDGIKVTLIEPGLVSTPMTEKPDQDQAEQERKMKSLQAEDIAEAVHYVLTQPKRCDVVSLQIRPHLQPI